MHWNSLWNRHRSTKHEQPGPARPDTAATAKAEALREARKGTAAEHPGIVVTPDRKMHAGAFVGDTFYEARQNSFPRYTAEQHARDVAEGEVPGENKSVENTWWFKQRYATGTRAAAGSASAGRPPVEAGR